MKKKTISAILWVVIALLSITIVILCVKISGRGPKPVDEIASVSDDDSSDVYELQSTTSANEPQEGFVARFDVVAIPETTSSVNVRSGPGTDYERIGSAYSNNEYVVYEVLESGWTKLDYEGQVGYISSEFLTYKNRQDLGDGTYSYEDISDDMTGYVAK